MWKNKKVLLMVGAVLAALAVVALILVLAGGNDPQEVAPTGPSGTQQTAPSGTDPGNQETQTTLPGQTEPEQTQPDATVETLPGQTEPSVTVPVETTPAQTEPEYTEPVYTDPTAPIADLEGSYEHWLSAAMVMAVSLEYPRFELVGIWAASATEISEAASSAGAYVLIRVGGQDVLIHSRPLKAERTQSGTRDLFTAQLGFATFDEVDPAKVDLSKLKEFSVEDISDMIAQSLLVTLYGH